MAKDLIHSPIDRQNILNNPYAVAEIEKAIGLRGIPFEGKRIVLQEQVAFFFRVSERTIKRYVERNRQELRKNGYEVIRGNRLKTLKDAIEDHHVRDIYVPNIRKAPVLSVFDFRAIMNLAMLLSESERASVLRQAILDIVIDTINARSGGGTKYINQRDEEYLERSFSGEIYRKEFTDALRDCVAMGKSKYPIYTDKVYDYIFKEKSRQYRKIINLEKYDKTRDTFYAEILTLISSFECGLAYALREKSEQLGRSLDPWEVDEVIDQFASQSHWRPLMEHARAKMASRDLALRGVKHSSLETYIKPLPPDEFERFLGEQSKTLEKRLIEAEDVLKRLKAR